MAGERPRAPTAHARPARGLLSARIHASRGRADLWAVHSHGAASFAEVLDGVLAGRPRVEPRLPMLDARPDPGLYLAMAMGGGGSRADVPSTRPARGAPGGWVAAWRAGAASAAVTGEAQPPSPASPVAEPPRPARAGMPPTRRRRVRIGVPGPAEWLALGILRQAGAVDLTDDFTFEDLRRAYRQLARRHHPDRHVGAPPVERLGTSLVFQRVHRAYLVLTALFARPDGAGAAA